ncbi:preprotein translocase subunit SecG [bacterium]|nr:preprotein translocase subunit SecG [bacterium]
MFLYVLILIVHVIVCIALVISVLLQSSKGGGLAGTFGGSGMTGGVFGGRGAAPFLAKATTAFAILFMLTSISLNFVKPGRVSQSAIQRALIESGAASSPSSSAVTTEMPVSTPAAGDNAQTGSETTPSQNAPAQEEKK